MSDTETRIALVEQNYQNLEKRLEKVENKLDSISEQMAAGD